MSIDITQDIMIGWRLEVDKLGCLRVTPAVVEMQPQFDPNTGEPTKPKRVVLENKKIEWQLGEARYEDFNDVGDHIMRETTLSVRFAFVGDTLYMIAGIELEDTGPPKVDYGCHTLGRDKKPRKNMFGYLKHAKSDLEALIETELGDPAIINVVALH